MSAVRNDPVLLRLREALAEIYGKRFDHAVLFGSRARGDGRPDSDYDIAVFLTDMADRWHELDRLADLRVQLLDEAGVVVDAKPYVVSDRADRTPLMHEIRNDGVRL